MTDPRAYVDLVNTWEAEHATPTDPIEPTFPPTATADLISQMSGSAIPRGGPEPPEVRGTPGRVEMEDERWEHGSDFHLSLERGLPDYPWTSHPHNYWGSGRDALRALVGWGRSAHGWGRVLCPSYFCQDVVAAIAHEAEIQAYPEAPTMSTNAELRVGAGEVALVVSLFGRPPTPTVRGEAVVVEDHSHDPISAWAHDSRADYAVASLRKTLPLPDGGVLWSPRGLDLPPERPMTASHGSAVFDRLSAMVLKGLYLSGSRVDKDDFRMLAVRGEAGFAHAETSGMSPFARSRLGSLPAGEWRAARAANLQAFCDALGEHPGVTVLDAPYAPTLIFDEPWRRDDVRAALIAVRIYPAVLWSLDDPVVEGIPKAHVHLARRILTLHSDQRYSPDDMARVAGEIRKTLGRR